MVLFFKYNKRYSRINQELSKISDFKKAEATATALLSPPPQQHKLI